MRCGEICLTENTVFCENCGRKSYNVTNDFFNYYSFLNFRIKEVDIFPL